MDLINKLIWTIRGRRVCAHSVDLRFKFKTKLYVFEWYIIGRNVASKCGMKFKRRVLHSAENIYKDLGDVWCVVQERCDFAMVRSVQKFRPARLPHHKV